MAQLDLPLFVPMDATLDDDERIIEAGPLAELVFLRLLRLAKRRQSDGRVHSRQALRLVADLRDLTEDPESILDDLVEVELLLVDGDHYRIRSWETWNPLSHQIAKRRADRRAARQEAGRKGAHERHHVTPGRFVSSCELCQEAGRDTIESGVANGAVASPPDGSSYTDPGPSDQAFLASAIANDGKSYSNGDHGDSRRDREGIEKRREDSPRYSPIDQEPSSSSTDGGGLDSDQIHALAERIISRRADLGLVDKSGRGTVRGIVGELARLGTSSERIYGALTETRLLTLQAALSSINGDQLSGDAPPPTYQPTTRPEEPPEVPT